MRAVLAVLAVLAVAVVAAVFSQAVGCGSDPVEAEPASDAVDTELSPEAPDWPLPPEYIGAWDVTTVAQGDVGTGLRLAVAGDGRVALAWFATASEGDGPCDELPDAVPPERRVWPLFYAESAGDAWNIEEVTRQLRIDPPAGIDLTFGPDGIPVIATQTGTPVVSVYYCGVNDVALLHRTAPGVWDPETAVVTSGEAVTGEAGSDYGEVVGLWPALAYDGNGLPRIAYKDVHAGSVQGDDFNRADLEIAVRSISGWEAKAVDFGRGAGDYNDLVVDGNGRSVILYGNPTTDPLDSSLGLWVSREVIDAAPDEAQWEYIRLLEGRVLERPVLAIHPDTDALVVAYYDADKGVPVLVTLSDPLLFDDLAGWTFDTFGDPSYDEGSHPSLAFDADGNVAVAYYRCARIEAGIGSCNAADDGVVLAVFDGTEWVREVVAPGGQGLCGRSPNLAFGPDGPIVAFQCAEAVGDTFTFAVQVAVPGLVANPE
jgi:hypothetical protein